MTGPHRPRLASPPLSARSAATPNTASNPSPTRTSVTAFSMSLLRAHNGGCLPATLLEFTTGVPQGPGSDGCARPEPPAGRGRQTVHRRPCGLAA